MDSGVFSEIEEAIQVLRNANTFIPEHNPLKADHLHDLGVAFRCRFERLGDLADLDEAITVQQQAVRLAPDDDPDRSTYFSDLAMA